ncbi:MAG: hypothetical protein ACLUB2_09105 [Butyricicoccus pullicaecorum]
MSPQSTASGGLFLGQQDKALILIAEALFDLRVGRVDRRLD